MIVRLLPLLLIACVAHAETVDAKALYRRHLQRQVLSDALALQTPLHGSGPSLSNGQGVDKETSTYTMRLTEGFDIPDGTMETKTFDEVCQCDDTCKHTQGCQAWVYHSDSKQCDLKSITLDPSKRVECDDCLYEESSGSMACECKITTWEGPEVTVHGTYSTEHVGVMVEHGSAEIAVQQPSQPSEMASVKELKESTGDIGQYGKDTGSREAKEGDQCRMSEGFDQPAEFNLMPESLWT